VIGRFVLASRLSAAVSSWLRPLLIRGRGAPLGDDPASRFLGFIAVLMGYLAALALAGAMSVSDMAGRWTVGLAGGLTVQVSALPPATAQARAAAALALTREAPGVRAAVLLDRAAAGRLLEPWLGPDAAGDPLLPIPALIDVTAAGPVDVAGLRARLSAAGTLATVDDHGVWLADLSAFAGATQAAALGVVALIVGAGLAAVVFAVRTGLALHEDVVRLLHLMGAGDAYISRQFEFHIGRRVLRGGALGALGAALTLIALDYAGGDLRAGLAPSLRLSAGEWATLLLFPPAMALPAVAAARWAVLRALERMP
jgi:cell division transport system permease protein